MGPIMSKSKPGTVGTILNHMRWFNKQNYKLADIEDMEKFRDAYRSAIQETLTKPLRGIVQEALEVRFAQQAALHSTSRGAQASQVAVSPAPTSQVVPSTTPASTEAGITQEVARLQIFDNDHELSTLDLQKGGVLKKFMLDNTYLNYKTEGSVTRPVPPAGLSIEFYYKDRDREYSGKRIQEEVFEILDEIEEHNEKRLAQKLPTYENDPTSMVWYTVCHHICVIGDELRETEPNSIIDGMYRITLLKNFISNLRSVDFKFDASIVSSSKLLISNLNTRLDDTLGLLIRYHSQLCAKDYLHSLHEQGAASINNLFKWIASIPSDVKVPRGFSLKKCMELTADGRQIRNKAVREYLQITGLGELIRRFIDTPACREFSNPYLFNFQPEERNFDQIEERGVTKDFSYDHISINIIRQTLRVNSEKKDRPAGIHKDFITQEHLTNFVRVFHLAQRLVVANIVSREIMKFAATAGNIGIYVLRRNEIESFLKETAKIVQELKAVIRKVSRDIEADYRTVKDNNQPDPLWYDAWTALDRRMGIMQDSLERVLVPTRRLLQEIESLSVDERLEQMTSQIAILDKLFTGMGIPITGPQLKLVMSGTSPARVEAASPTAKGSAATPVKERRASGNPLVDELADATSSTLFTQADAGGAGAASNKAAPEAKFVGDPEQQRQEAERIAAERYTVLMQVLLQARQVTRAVDPLRKEVGKKLMQAYYDGGRDGLEREISALEREQKQLIGNAELPAIYRDFFQQRVVFLSNVELFEEGITNELLSPEVRKAVKSSLFVEYQITLSAQSREQGM
jgi:hypothetical protein